MIKKEFLQIVDHVKRILREKTRKYQALEASTSSSSKLQPKEIFCTYEEVLECFTTREKTGYGMQTSAFKNQLSVQIENNPKIKFNRKQEKFIFIKKFEDKLDFMEKLYESKRGVINDEELWDDVSKQQIDAILNNKQYVRKIEFNEKRGGGLIKDKEPENPNNVNNPPQPASTTTSKGKYKCILFAKNYYKDDIESQDQQERTPKKLKDYFRGIDDDEMERLKEENRLMKSSIRQFNKKNKGFGQIGQKKTFGRKGRPKNTNRETLEKNKKNWQNQHIWSKISGSLSRVPSEKISVNKKK